MYHSVDHGVGASLAEGLAAGGGEGDRCAPGKDVDRRRGVSALGLLRGHPRRGAHHRTGLGERRAVGRDRDPEVDDLGPALGHQHVGGLEVTVDDAGGAHGDETLGQADGEAHQPVAFEGAVLGHVVGQVAAGDVLAHQVGPGRVQISVEVVGGAHAADALAGSDLAGEAGPEPMVGGQLLADELERNFAPRGIRGQVDDTHATRPDAGVQAVGPSVLGVAGVELVHVAFRLRSSPVSRAAALPAAPAYGGGVALGRALIPFR